MIPTTNNTKIVGALMLLICLAVHVDAQVATWAVAPKPLTIIGVADGPANQEIVNVSAARRLADGHVLVANGKPLELRRYDATGKFVNLIGHKGEGPGEYRSLLSLLPGAGDTATIYDRGNGRVALFLASGKLVRENRVEESARFDGGVVLFRRSLVYGLKLGESGCLKQLLTRLPPPAPPQIRQVFSDGAGRFWVRSDAGTSWTVYSSIGTALGRVTLPTGFQLYQAGPGFVVGKRLMEDDVEQVQVLGLAPPATRAVGPCTAPPDSFPSIKSERATVLTKALRDAMTAGEMAYSNYATYVGSLDSLPDLRNKLPAESAFTGFLTSNRGWGAMVFDKRSTLVCAFGVGSAALPGWAEGSVICRE